MQFIQRLSLWFVFSALMFSCRFAGSYPYAETYKLISEDSTVVKSIALFKKQHPDYSVPSTVGLIDGKTDLWYHVYFYYADKNEIVHTWIRSLEQGEATFALVGINTGLELGHWKIINRDFNVSENRQQKQIFETRILNPIRKMVENPVLDR